MYEDAIAFFYDCLGGEKIGGVWLPGLRAPKPFKVRERYSSVPAHQVSTSHVSRQTHAVDCRVQAKKDKKKVLDVVLNEIAIIAEIERMGQGLIKSITVHQK